MTGLSRREFLHCAPAIFFAPTLLDRPVRSPVRIALVYAPEYHAIKRGAEVSAAEVRRAAALLRREFAFAAVPAAELRAAEWTGIINATSQPIGAPGTTIVDVTGHSPCAAHVLKLIPPGCPPPCVLWHGSLARFGAEQLNDRFRAARIDPIDSQSWLGWFAVKLLWEAGVRARPARDLSYDGHKGRALRFNAAGVLLQPVYRVDNGKVVDEIEIAEDTACSS